MPVNSLQILDLNDLRQYVHQTLCESHDFEIGAFTVTERYLVRGGMPCGIFFCLHGPRQVRLTAIWETERNTILFYGSTGERLMRTRLIEAPTLVSAEAA